MTRPPLQESDLIFSSAASELKNALGELKKHNLKISNRLKSIKQDSHFICTVSLEYSLPLVANERCGSWYIPPEKKVGSAYFKSTDGHFGQWGFSLRRLNLQVLDVVEEYGGCVVVDSTRRGKSMPDALSKTVPIWCCVVNRLLFGEEGGELSTPMDVVGESEHAQIEARLDAMLEGVRKLDLDLQGLRQKLGGKPMRVVWRRPGDEMTVQVHDDEKVNLIVLCTASNQTSHESSATSEYVQGAADDPESWSLGLDAVSFWRHQEQLLAANEDELPDLIRAIMENSKANGALRTPVLIKPTSKIWIGTNEAAGQLHEDYDIVISCVMAPDPSLTKAIKSRYITLSTPCGKNGSRLLRAELPKLTALTPLLESDSRVLITCETGRDLAVAVALVVLCQYYDQEGQTRSPDLELCNMSKTYIKHRLSWIMVSMPDANPSRATLQSVNAYLLG